MTVLIIALATVMAIYILPLIPNFLKTADAGQLSYLQPQFILVFLIFDAIMIGIPAWIHKVYVNDHSKIKNVWFFALFGGVIGALLGEGGNVVMIIPYTILMMVYAHLYKRFAWWKVALTAYLGGIVVENIINRAPIQGSTLVWVAFFIYPYFATKIFENRKTIRLSNILKGLKWVIIASLVTTGLAAYATRNNLSPPLMLWGAALPFLAHFLYKTFRKRR